MCFAKIKNKKNKKIEKIKNNKSKLYSRKDHYAILLFNVTMRSACVFLGILSFSLFVCLFLEEVKKKKERHRLEKAKKRLKKKKIKIKQIGGVWTENRSEDQRRTNEQTEQTDRETSRE